jgi:phenylalanyl-tRNA synthetase alpha subunit
LVEIGGCGMVDPNVLKIVLIQKNTVVLLEWELKDCHA